MTTPRTRPPFRADHVGSLLRPARLIAAREDRKAGRIDAAALRAVEDACIREVVKLQEDVGLRSVTDGEFRRESWNFDFLSRLTGVEMRESTFVSRFRRADGVDVSRRPMTAFVASKLTRDHPIQRADFEFLASAAGTATPKVTIPSPSMLHFRGGRKAVSREAYPEMAAFFADLAAAYNAEMRDLAAAGCRYLQLDDTNLAYLCDPEIREATVKMGEDPNDLPRAYCRLINESVKGRPTEMAVTVHLCRGNFRSAWVAEGGYEPVAEVLFDELDVDGFFLEYDDARSGDFAPLRFVPKGKVVVLGLVTTKTAALESRETLLRRIEEAAKYVPLDQLALSPQCGFSSTVQGNELTVDDEVAKLRLIVETAREVWGDA